jgi:hypothetical protein
MTRSTEVRIPVETQAYTAKDFLCKHLANMDEDITGVYAVSETDGIRVSILLRDFWGPVSKTVYAVLYDLRRELDVPNVDIVVLPADAVGDNFAQDENMDCWL